MLFADKILTTSNLLQGYRYGYHIDERSLTAGFTPPHNDLSPAGVLTYDGISSKAGFILYDDFHPKVWTAGLILSRIIHNLKSYLKPVYSLGFIYFGI